MKTPTMLDILAFGRAHQDATVQQYAAHLGRLFDKRGYADRHLRALDGSLESYRQIAPKYRRGNAHLNQKIRAWGIKPATYKQYQADGRRMIEHFHGELQKRRERRGRQDGFARLQAVLPDLISAVLLKEPQARNLPRLFDLARARGWDMTDLRRDRIIDLRHDCLSSDEWGRVKQGAACLDYLRQFPTCQGLLPPHEIGSLAGILRFDREIPEFLADEAQLWVEGVTVVYQEGMLTEGARQATSKEHSEGSRGIYTAAIRTYIRTAKDVCDLHSVNGLTALFRPDAIEKVFVLLCKRSGSPGGLSPRSLASYANKLKLTLIHRGLDEEAAKIEQLLKSLPILAEGQAAGQLMSEKTKTWCRDLLADPVKAELFETQHFQYAENALAALELAEIEGIDLLGFSQAPEVQPLSPEQSGLAKTLLRQARMYGVCAAFSAIELEGAPFRKSNVIRDLRLAGHPQTFFDHRNDLSRPRLEIHIPNELLKNGEAMTKRNQHMPRFVFERGGLGGDGFRILSFYLSRIRPLFGGATLSDHLFPALENEDRHLVISTFDGWLAHCSAAIGLHMLPHNFRHGLCSIEINDDPTCYPELEAVTGDSEATLRRYYAFIDTLRRIRTLQARRYERQARRSAAGEERVGDAA
ncbi:hypothetical protein [Maricaulis maris]|uniref:hypothetical protein n=1 Tax=Maricaulis maris TaxID=74318 RepID=UPI003A8D55A2